MGPCLGVAVALFYNGEKGQCHKNGPVWGVRFVSRSFLVLALAGILDGQLSFPQQVNNLLESLPAKGGDHLCRANRLFSNNLSPAGAGR